MPVRVRDGSASTVMYDVELTAAQRLAPPGFEVIESAPGRAQFALTLIDYRDNDLGTYLEIGTILFVRPAGSGPNGPEGTFILRLPVDDEFSRVAGNDIWGFPKTVERIDVTLGVKSARWDLEMDGAHVLTATVPRGGTEALPERELTAYSIFQGRPHATTFTQGGSGAGFFTDATQISLSLGDHPLSKELASLGLPASPIFCVSIDHMRGEFGDPRPL